MSSGGQRERDVRYASVSLDLDNQWSYMKTRGDAAWQAFPSYFDVVVPRILEFLERRTMKISFFIVGQDAALPGNARPLRQISASGHEIASHSYAHDPWLHLYSDEQLERDLVMAEEAIAAATGARPVGFRGPGFSLSAATLELLAKRGYAYDATVFPNLLNPLARAYFFSAAKLSREERRQRSALFGSWTDARRPVKPFRWRLRDGELLEIPVTTMPYLKVPIHLSYLIYLAKFSGHAARAYFRMAMVLCRVSRTSPSILLHPLDFLGEEDCPQLRFFPGMDMPASRKLTLASEFLAMLADRYEIVTVGEHARRATSSGLHLRSLRPDLRR
jgi:peptidoglycan/xylan/chitin deacetylase (PgdA/CDA1 family)